MGFLRKDWDWENPATHEMKQQEEERKDRKGWLWILALICGGLSVYSLYYIENTIYGGAVETNWAGWLGTMIGTCIAAGLHVFKEPKPIKDKWGKVKKITGNCFLAVFCVVIAIYIWKHQRMWLFGLQIFSIFPVALALDKVQKAGADKGTVTAWDLILTFVFLAVVTLNGPKILGAYTVEEAVEELRNAGYTAVEYKCDIDAFWIEHILPNAEVEADTADWGDLYLFQIGENSGEAMVEPWTGTIIAE